MSITRLSKGVLKLLNSVLAALDSWHTSFKPSLVPPHVQVPPATTLRDMAGASHRARRAGATTSLMGHFNDHLTGLTFFQACRDDLQRITRAKSRPSSFQQVHDAQAPPRSRHRQIVNQPNWAMPLFGTGTTPALTLLAEGAAGFCQCLAPNSDAPQRRCNPRQEPSTDLWILIPSAVRDRRARLHPT